MLLHGQRKKPQLEPEEVKRLAQRIRRLLEVKFEDNKKIYLPSLIEDRPKKKARMNNRNKDDDEKRIVLGVKDGMVVDSFQEWINCKTKEGIDDGSLLYKRELQKKDAALFLKKWEVHFIGKQ